MCDAAVVPYVKAGFREKGVKFFLFRAKKNFTSFLTEIPAIDRSQRFFRRAKKESEGEGGGTAEVFHEIQPESRRAVFLSAPRPRVKDCPRSPSLFTRLCKKRGFERFLKGKLCLDRTSRGFKASGQMEGYMRFFMGKRKTGK
jgi:hypothetical protein